MKVSRKTMRIALSVIAALIVIIGAGLIYILNTGYDPNKLVYPEQVTIDKRSDLLMNHLNDPSRIPEMGPVLESDNGRFRAAEGSPTADKAQYLFAAALPMEGCQYVNWSASRTDEITSIDDVGDELTHRAQAPGMDKIALVDITSQISCKDKKKLPTVKIRYGLLHETGAWSSYTRIYSVKYQ